MKARTAIVVKPAARRSRDRRGGGGGGGEGEEVVDGWAGVGSAIAG